MLIPQNNPYWAIWYHIAHARHTANDNALCGKIENYLMRYAERLEK